jgi:hypothetical protein
MNHCIVVGIATSYRPDEQGGQSSTPDRVRNFHFSILSNAALGSTQLPIQWILGVLFPGGGGGRAVMLTTHPICLHGIVLN